MRKSPRNNSTHPSEGPSENKMGLVGKILVASPAMTNSYFARTAILLLQQNTEGAAGVVLNRPAAHSIQQIWEQVSETPCTRQQVFHFGGPLPGPMVALHRQASLGEVQLSDDLYVAAERSVLDRLIAQDDQDDDTTFRLFVGHAGWGPGQLERELRQGSWMLLPADAVEVFAAESELWYQAVRQVGASVIRLVVPESRIPPDPCLN